MKKAKLRDSVGCDGTDLFVVRNGTRIAMRGRPGTPHAKTWVSLEPGFVVVDGYQQGGRIIAIGNPTPTRRDGQ